MRRLIALGLVLFAVGCAKKEEEDELTPPSSIFTTEDLEQGLTSNDSPEYFGYSLSSHEAIYANEPEYANAEATFDGCRHERIAALKVSADVLNIEVNGDVDVTDCPAPGEGFTITKAVEKIRLWVGCPDGDVEGFDGKTVAELSELDDACGEKIDHQIFSNADRNYEYTYAGEDSEGNAFSYTGVLREIRSTQTASGKPCDLSHGTDTYTISDKCETISKDISTTVFNGSSSSSTSEEFAKFGFRSITVADAGAPNYYSSGSLETVLNNWTGTITYSGAANAPTYSFTDGTTTVEGTVGVNSGLQNDQYRGLDAHVRRIAAARGE